MNAKWEVWKAKDGWRWRLKAANGRIVAESGEAYTRRSSALRAITKLVTPVIWAVGP